MATAVKPTQAIDNGQGSAGVDAGPALPTSTLTLAERLLKITEELGTVKATGKNFTGGKAHSIADIENAVRPLLIKHGILMRPTHGSVIQTSKDWIASIRVHVGLADFRPLVNPLGTQPDKGFDDEWADSGSTPASAYSYARKSYLKALFHIADTSDEGTNTTTQRQSSRPRSQPLEAGELTAGDVAREAWRLFETAKEQSAYTADRRWTILHDVTGWTKGTKLRDTFQRLNETKAIELRDKLGDLLQPDPGDRPGNYDQTPIPM